ncbi:hypothetical protein OTAKU_00410 [Serratia phage vB_SmaM-Otaku]|uniref:Uncharacterized protein n=1 Tax=Serratia phage vB_SmaM-Otaku TaxID=2932867 RepID=A0AAE9HHC9_9CAUD|nr:hypothetical protein PF631_gp41 [Serratia phage vB_SmaM-Otaku]UPU16030.1 hypothetical protein OTAKU_00410 [Serratia phage vB_SmaM-Otaku]
MIAITLLSLLAAADCKRWALVDRIFFFAVLESVIEIWALVVYGWWLYHA